jgi:hypothetical protein
MKRLNDNEIILSNEELDSIREFIRSTLDSDWDQHTNRFYGCKETNEEGMRRMGPTMYDIANEMGII